MNRSMIRNWFTHKTIALGGMILALVMFVISMTGIGKLQDTDSIAERTADRVEKRLRILDKHIENALQTPAEDLMLPDRIPDDMVIYLFVNDSLMSWNNQFPILNDNISVKIPFERMMPANNGISSPLANISEELEYMNLGSKWYIVKAVTGENRNKVIAGLEIKNSLSYELGGNDNGTNSALNIPAEGLASAFGGCIMTYSCCYVSLWETSDYYTTFGREDTICILSRTYKRNRRKRRRNPWETYIQDIV